MTPTPAIIARLKDAVPDLQGRVHGAASLAAIMAKEAVPSVTPCVHVVPSGVTARATPSVMSGGYIQIVERGWALFLSLRVHDPTGAQALDEADGLIDAIMLAIAGWEPTPDAIGVFVFRHAVLRTLDRGVAIYEISFSISDQLRISA